MDHNDTAQPHPQVSGDTILDTAKSLIYGDREAQYGSALGSFTDIGEGWSIILKRKMLGGVTITAEDAALMLDWLKTARLVNQPGHIDSIIDKAGYAGCYEKIVKERKALEDIPF